MLKPHYTDSLIEGGCDEVGRGCLAGPIVAAAVILPKGYTHPVLNDSKQLSKAQRRFLSPLIKSAAIDWAIGEASNEEIDKINIVQATYLAMHRALAQLKQKPQFLLIDGNRFKPYQAIPYQCIVKGDTKFAAIAAASVLAKHYRDELMGKLAHKFPGYLWEKNVGYPTKVHWQAIQQLGVTPYHRRTFRLFKKI